MTILEVKTAYLIDIGLPDRRVIVVIPTIFNRNCLNYILVVLNVSFTIVPVPSFNDSILIFPS